jgi:hypothetical protein
MLFLATYIVATKASKANRVPETAESRRQEAESRRQKAGGRKQEGKAESRRQ